LFSCTPQVAGFAELLFNCVDKLFEGACDVPTLLSPTAFTGAHVHQLLPKVCQPPAMKLVGSRQQLGHDDHCTYATRTAFRQKFRLSAG